MSDNATASARQIRLGSVVAYRGSQARYHGPHVVTEMGAPGRWHLFGLISGVRLYYVREASFTLTSRALLSCCPACQTWHTKGRQCPTCAALVALTVMCGYCDQLATHYVVSSDTEVVCRTCARSQAIGRLSDHARPMTNSMAARFARTGRTR